MLWGNAIFIKRNRWLGTSETVFTGGISDSDMIVSVEQNPCENMKHNYKKQLIITIVITSTKEVNVKWLIGGVVQPEIESFRPVRYSSKRRRMLVQYQIKSNRQVRQVTVCF